MVADALAFVTVCTVGIIFICEIDFQPAASWCEGMMWDANEFFYNVFKIQLNRGQIS